MGNQIGDMDFKRFLITTTLILLQEFSNQNMDKIQVNYLKMETKRNKPNKIE